MSDMDEDIKQQINGFTAEVRKLEQRRDLTSSRMETMKELKDELKG